MKLFPFLGFEYINLQTTSRIDLASNKTEPCRSSPRQIYSPAASLVTLGIVRVPLRIVLPSGNGRFPPLLQSR